MSEGNIIGCISLLEWRVGQETNLFFSVQDDTKVVQRFVEGELVVQENDNDVLS
jgi:hypothetical protein